MKKLLAAAFALLATAGIASACPAWQNTGVQTGYVTGQDLWSPNHYSVIAGGSQSLRNCGWDHSGHVISRPDFEFQIGGLESYNHLQLRVNGSCDTVLMVHAPNGQWYFNDDGWGNLHPLLNVTHPRSGIYNIWVGTYGTHTCGATLEMETF